jgi:signal transduction histidine kinase
MDLRMRELPQAALADELHHEAQRTIEEVRRLTRALRPIYLEDLGLVPALEMLTRDLQADLGIPIAIRTTGAPRRLPAETELALYRIAQEALNNVGKHAQARRAWLELAFSEDGLSMAIGDDGVGFSPTDAAKDPASQGHFGLIGMRERADLIQAQLEIASKPGHGTQITVRLSVPSAPAV